MKVERRYRGTSKKIPFEVRLERKYDWFVQAIVDITLPEGTRKLTVHTTVQDDESWERAVRDILSIASMTAWQVLGITHPNAKQLEAVETAFRLELYEEVKEEENANA